MKFCLLEIMTRIFSKELELAEIFIIMTSLHSFESWLCRDETFKKM